MAVDLPASVVYPEMCRKTKYLIPIIELQDSSFVRLLFLVLLLRDMIH